MQPMETERFVRKIFVKFQLFEAEIRNGTIFSILNRFKKKLYAKFLKS